MPVVTQSSHIHVHRPFATPKEKIQRSNPNHTVLHCPTKGHQHVTQVEFAHQCRSVPSSSTHAHQSVISHFRLLPVAPPPAPYGGRSPIRRRLLPPLRLPLRFRFRPHLRPWPCLRPLPAAPGKTAVAAGTLRGAFRSGAEGGGAGKGTRLATRVTSALAHWMP